MSVSIREVIEHGGYDLTTLDDARWLVSQQSNFETLVEEAEETIERLEAEAEGYDGFDLNDGTHSRFDESHYRNCQPCYDDHLDFMQECEMDARLDEAAMREEFGDDLEFSY